MTTDEQIVKWDAQLRAGLMVAEPREDRFGSSLLLAVVRRIHDLGPDDSGAQCLTAYERVCEVFGVISQSALVTHRIRTWRDGHADLTRRRILRMRRAYKHAVMVDSRRPVWKRKGNGSGALDPLEFMDRLTLLADLTGRYGVLGDVPVDELHALGVLPFVDDFLAKAYDSVT